MPKLKNGNVQIIKTTPLIEDNPIISASLASSTVTINPDNATQTYRSEFL
jgi:hypothetical protein